MISPYQQRVIDEKKELDAKIAKLKEFCLTSIFDDLPSRDKILLTEQEGHMVNYSGVLWQRIIRFSP